jgi:translation elongation factor EF-Tu-like GTPase
MPQAKPHFNILTLGHQFQGKTTLVDAIAKVLTKKGQTVVQTIPKKDNGVNIALTHNAFQTQKNDYTLVDCAQSEDVEKYLITRTIPLHGGILVVAPTHGFHSVMIERELFYFQQLGITNVIIFLNIDNTDPDTDSVNLSDLENDIIDRLGRYDINNPYAVIQASALDALSGDAKAEASILELLALCDKFFSKEEPMKPYNCTKFECMLYLLNDHGEGGRSRKMPLRLEDRAFLMFDTIERRGNRKILIHDDRMYTGEHALMELTLDSPIPLVPEQRFLMLEGSNTVIGVCRVTTKIYINK